MSDALRQLPKLDDLLRQPTVLGWLGQHPRAVIVDALRASVQEQRSGILAGQLDSAPSTEALLATVISAASRRLAESEQLGLRRCLNATGILLHTNMGRAPLSAEAVRAVAEVAAGYSNLELDLASGRRGDRSSSVEAQFCAITGAAAAAVTNNCAAATVLMLTALAAGREVIVSRGQLVEIGGSFRLPEVFATSGCTLREVGTTNRTRLADYAAAVSDRTAAILRVHSGNFAVIGFTEQPTLAELVELSRQRGIPLIDDVGSGLLRRELLGRRPSSAPGWTPAEPVVAESLAAGADLVCFSGDKLLGGPQAGVLLGRAELIAAIRRHPLMRAVRLDKMTLAALEATLRLHRDPETARARVPFWRMLSESEDAVRARGLRLAERLLTACAGLDVVLTESVASAGGGSLPTEELPSWSVTLDPAPASAESFAERLRRQPIPLIGTIRRGRVCLDCRTLADEELELAVAAVRAAHQAGTAAPPPLRPDQA